MKQIIKAVIPEFILVMRENYLNAKHCKELAHLTPKEAFTKVYDEGLWGKPSDGSDHFFSGTGSHSENIVSAYVIAIEKYLIALSNNKLNVVDLGCGDFAVGSQVRKFCGTYIACDVVDSLISRNRKKFENLDVDFRVLDLIADDLPDGDVVFIRQVLQHLSNKQILAVIPKLQEKYRFLVLTEHLPATKSFDVNLDKPVGAGIRLGQGKNGSGIVLTEPPFNLKVINENILCEVNEDGGVIRTIAYQLS